MNAFSIPNPVSKNDQISEMQREVSDLLWHAKMVFENIYGKDKKGLMNRI